MDPLIAVENVIRRYAHRVALAGVSFEVEPGEIVGLLGPNGAGKSTTLSILATLLEPDDGEVRVAGCRLPRERNAARRAIGFVPQRVAVYPSLTATENVVFFARMQGLTATGARDAAADALATVALEGRSDEPVARFSGGMLRRLNLACGIAHRPRVLLLDEPTVGIDPQSRERIFEAVARRAKEGAAVLYSTHAIEEAERLCDRVVLIDVGRVVAAGRPAELISEENLSPKARVRTARAVAAGWEPDVDGARVVRREGVETFLELSNPAMLPAVLDSISRSGTPVLEIRLEMPNLSDVFFRHTGRALRDEALEA